MKISSQEPRDEPYLRPEWPGVLEVYAGCCRIWFEDICVGPYRTNPGADITTRPWGYYLGRSHLSYAICKILADSLPQRISGNS